MANWTSLAYEQLWLPDDQVLGVTPFLLAGQFWEPMGWPWTSSATIAVTGAATRGDEVVSLRVVVAASRLEPRLVYNATRQLRCRVVGGAGC